MNLLTSQQKIRDLMATFVFEAKGASAMGHADINHVAETVLIPLFAETYSWEHLENLNDSLHANFPAVDLGDREARVAIQITATSDSTKIKHTLQKFVQYELYNTFDRLIIYILTEKQQSYSGSGYDEIIQNRFLFDRQRDIWDYRTLLAEVARLQLDRVQRIENILEANFGRTSVPMFGEIYIPSTETVYLNLLEVTFPDTIYAAELLPQVEDTHDNKGSFRRGRKGKWAFKPLSSREVVQNTLKQQGLRFSSDWIVHERKIFTFHDLNDNSLPICEVIDTGTVEAFSPDEIYSIDEDYKSVFKALLRFCLQQKLYHLGVRWQYAEKMFVFCDMEGESVRREEWFGKKENDRVVFERYMKTDKPSEIWYCKHFAFEGNFHHFGKQWYISIKPDWFFSYDGYTKSFYSADKLKWLKKHENNHHYANHIKFLAYFLRPRQDDLFNSPLDYPFLLFGEYVSFDNAPSLNDNEFLPHKTDKQSAQLPLDIEDL